MTKEQIWTLEQGDVLQVSGPAAITAREIGNRRNRRVRVCVKAAADVTVTVASAHVMELKESPTPRSADNKPG